MKASSTKEDAKGALCCAPDPRQAKVEATIGAPKGALCRVAAPSQLAVDFPVIKLAVGLHPWWVPVDEGCLAEGLRAFDAALSETSYVGEVGLDFSRRRIATRDAQLCAFRHIAGACAKEGGKVLSVHCVKAYDDALSILKVRAVLRRVPAFSIGSVARSAACAGSGRGLFLFG